MNPSLQKLVVCDNEALWSSFLHFNLNKCEESVCHNVTRENKYIFCSERAFNFPNMVFLRLSPKLVQKRFRKKCQESVCHNSTGENKYFYFSEWRLRGKDKDFRNFWSWNGWTRVLQAYRRIGWRHSHTGTWTIWGWRVSTGFCSIFTDWKLA